jgi:hypothetical protein
VIGRSLSARVGDVGERRFDVDLETGSCSLGCDPAPGAGERQGSHSEVGLDRDHGVQMLDASSKCRVRNSEAPVVLGMRVLLDVKREPASAAGADSAAT